jgi:hypothetical protein
MTAAAVSLLRRKLTSFERTQLIQVRHAATMSCEQNSFDTGGRGEVRPSSFRMQTSVPVSPINPLPAATSTVTVAQVHAQTILQKLVR